MTIVTKGTPPAQMELLTAAEAAAYLRVGVATITKWCRTGVLSAVKVGKGYRMRRSDLTAWYDALAQRAGVDAAD